jgi:hypothetical protein
VYELTAGKASKPFPWWDTTKVDKLTEDVTRSIDAMADVDEKVRFLDHCVLYESQREAPRKGLIKTLESLDLDAPSTGAVDELAVPE